MLRSEVQSAALIVDSPVPTSSRTLTPAQRNGLRYQTRVEQELQQIFPGRLLLRPWFRYKEEWAVKKCQPDIVLHAEDASRLCIIEVKYSTAPGAWQQLLRYQRILAKAYRVPISLALVTRMFDPHVKWECLIKQLEGLERLSGWRGEGLAVVSWNGKRAKPETIRRV